VALSRHLAGLVIAAGLLLANQQLAIAQSSGVLPAWDASVVAGGFVADRDKPATVEYRQWFKTGTIGVVAGRYWSPHLKTEIEFSTTGESDRYISRYVGVTAAQYAPTFGSEQFLRTHEVSATAVWQFFENQWAHPFLQGGVAVDFETSRIHTWPQSYYTGDPRNPANRVVLSEERSEGPTTSSELRAVVGGGAKFYLTPLVFFRTDARVTLGRAGRHAMFRGGFGVDF
jgi:hypothetical protein